MALVRILLAVGLWLAILFEAPAAQTAKSNANAGCLSPEQQRNAVSSGRAVALSKAIRASKRRTQGEVIRAQLCQEPNGALVYRLTLLARSGKVTRAVIDATNGAEATER